MRRFRTLSLPVAVCAAALAPAAATADVIELGATATPVAAPTCPSGLGAANCTIILTETTALQTEADGVLYPTTVTKAGRIVAYTVGLARLSKTEITGLNGRYGGTSQVGIVVLHPGPQRQYTVTEASPVRHATPFFGHVVQFPLETSLRVNPGDVVGLTVSTWAPVLSIGMTPKRFQYRASRSAACTTYNIQTAQLSLGASTRYLCFYVGTRVQYSATEITYPVVPKDAVRDSDRKRAKTRAAKTSRRPVQHPVVLR